MNFNPFTVTVRGRLVTFSRPAVMGILNITPDSFYDGSRHSTPEAMLSHAHWLLDEGADMLARLLKLLTPGSKEFDKALNATPAQRRRMYKKYGIA